MREDWEEMVSMWKQIRAREIAGLICAGLAAAGMIILCIAVSW